VRFLYAPPPVTSLASPELNPARANRARRIRLNAVDLRANRALKWLALGGGVVIFIAMVGIVYQVIDGASLAFGKYGVGFLADSKWIPSPVTSLARYGAWPFIYGTLVTSVVSVILSMILGVSIGLFLGLLAPRRVSMVIGPLVEMLAAVPSVVLGLIGIYLICPFISRDLEPPLHAVLGWTGVFGQPQPVGNSLFAASLVLTIMVVPIVAALTRDLFLTVPGELRDGAEALGATRWEMIRGVVLPTTRSGIVAAGVLGFGRAIGEAIAVTAVVGGSATVSANLFEGGNTNASMIASQYINAVSNLQISALFYLALILFVFSVIVNLTARQIAKGPTDRGRLR